MGRIRTVKPELFTHEGLNELGALSMLFFIGLITQCDKQGVFPWRPKQLKLSIMPFIDYDVEEELSTLEGADFVYHFSVDGKEYGCIPTFLTHQRISGKELSQPGKYPAPPEKRQGSTREAPEKHPRSTREASEKHPDASRVPLEREREREKERITARAKRRAPSKAVAPFRDPLRDALAESFKAKVSEFASPAKENANLLRLASAIRRKAEADQVESEEAARGCLEAFWRLHESGKQFFAPFSPSKMLSALDALWDEWKRERVVVDESWDRPEEASDEAF